MIPHRLAGMKMCHVHLFARAIALFMLTAGSGLHAQIAGQLFVAGVHGQATFQRADNDQPQSLTPKQSTLAERTHISTDGASQTTLVFSNNTALHLGERTHVEILEFSQQVFPAVRNDLDAEPSASQLAIKAHRGALAFVTGALQPESRVTIHTPHADIMVHGRKCAVEVSDLETRVFLIEGRVDASGRGSNSPAQTLRPGQQAIVRHAADRASITVAIQPIMDEQQAELDAHVSHASLARRRVLFDFTETGSLRAMEMSPPEASAVVR